MLAMFMNNVQECSNCGKPQSRSNELKACPWCKHTQYCSMDCQKIHWKRHKHVCKEARRLARGSNNNTSNHDDPVNPCPICLTNEGELQCSKCGQLFCEECEIELAYSDGCNSCPTCRVPFNLTDEEVFTNMYSLVHDRSAGPRTRFAQFSLGGMYAKGKGVQRDYALALTYFKLAADQGDVAAQCNVGKMCRSANIEGVQQDHTLAVKYFKLAADHGRADAQRNLGHMYRNGEGVLQDHTLAIKYYTLAADQGNPDAQFSLGVILYSGVGAQQDHALAIKYLGLAADQGLASAQYNLGFMYQRGEGVENDELVAIRYFKLAATQGEAHAICALNRVRSNWVLSAVLFLPSIILGWWPMTLFCVFVLWRYRSCWF